MNYKKKKSKGTSLKNGPGSNKSKVTSRENGTGGSNKIKGTLQENESKKIQYSFVASP